MKPEKFVMDKHTVDELAKLVYSLEDEFGREIPNPEPVFMEDTTGRRTLTEKVQAIVRQEMSLNARYQGFETFDESNDFEIDEDPLPLTDFEIPEMAPDNPQIQDESLINPVSEEQVGAGSADSIAPGEAQVNENTTSETNT